MKNDLDGHESGAYCASITWCRGRPTQIR